MNDSIWPGRKYYLADDMNNTFDRFRKYAQVQKFIEKPKKRWPFDSSVWAELSCENVTELH